MLKTAIEAVAPAARAENAAYAAATLATATAPSLGAVVLYVAFAAGLVILGRFGLRGLRDDERGAAALERSPVATPIVGEPSVSARAAAAPHRASPAGNPFEPPPPGAPGVDAVARAEAPARAGADRPRLDVLRARMDEVTYRPGDPNVLALTKHVPADAPADARPRCALARADEGAVTTLRLEGSLDVLAAAELRPALEALVAERRAAITVELGGVGVVDSMGVGLVLTLYKRATALGTTVAVRGLRDQPLAVFRLLKLDRVFDLQ